MTLCNAESADWYLKINVNRCIQTSQKSRSHLKILGARRLTQSKFYAEDPQTLGKHDTMLSHLDDLVPRIYETLM
jgi:nitrate reductase cytochrome c-type subunit